MSYAGLPEAVAPEDRLLLADGTIELRVREIEGSEIRCTVVTGGTLSARKGVNVPSGLPDLPILGEKDLRDLRFGMQHGVDYVGLSFVRTAEDVRTAKREMARLGGRTPVIAKIETRSALDHLDEILAEADGVMVARGDLSIETAFTRVPIVQKVVIAEANRRAKPAITATQMLYSMVESPTPDARRGGGCGQRDRGRQRRRHALRGDGDRTPPRARGPDDGGDRGGHRPRRALEGRRVGRRDRRPPRTEHEAVVEAACRLAARLDVGVIATITRDGETARLAAKYRPRQPILAVTPRSETYRQLALVRGVVPVLLPTSGETPEALVAAARAVAHEHGWGGRPGDLRRPRPRAVHDGLRTGDRRVVGVTRPGGARPVRRCGLQDQISACG